MNIVNTEFEGLILLEPKIFYDRRGMFYESWRFCEYKKYGIRENFLQDNVSVSSKNVLRGMHYQHNQGQLVTVTHGSIFDVVIDNRLDSNTYKKYFSVELNSAQAKQLYMPPGFAHGFLVLSDIAVVNYKCTQYYDPEKEGGIIWNDPVVGIQWPINNPIISQKDSLFPSISEVCPQC